MPDLIKIFVFDGLSTLQLFYRVVSTRKTAGDFLYSHQVGVARVRRKRATPMKLMMTQVSSLGWSPAAPMAKAITPALAMEAPTLLQDIPTSRPAPGRRGGGEELTCLGAAAAEELHGGAAHHGDCAEEKGAGPKLRDIMEAFARHLDAGTFRSFLVTFICSTVFIIYYFYFRFVSSEYN